MTNFHSLSPGLFRDMKGFVWVKLAAENPAQDANGTPFNAVRLIGGEMKLFADTDDVIET